MIGTCSLCREEKTLQDSHLIPAGFFRLLRIAGTKNPNPVRIGMGRANTTSEQITSHFLCSDCEQLLNKRGEMYVLKNCRRSDTEFGIGDIAQSLPLIDENGDTRALALGDSDQEMARYCSYFAASVFWRGSAGRWRIKGRTLTLAKLGPYEEEFRQYLLGMNGFPQHASLVMQVSDNLELDQAILLPETIRHKQRIRHKFHIPGMLFVLFVGKSIPDEPNPLSIAPSATAILHGSMLRDDWFRRSAESAAKAKRVGKFK